MHSPKTSATHGEMITDSMDKMGLGDSLVTQGTIAFTNDSAHSRPIGIFQLVWAEYGNQVPATHRPIIAVATD